MLSSLPGFEPGTFGLEVQRAIHCATGTEILLLATWQTSNSATLPGEELRRVEYKR